MTSTSTTLGSIQETGMTTLRKAIFHLAFPFLPSDPSPLKSGIGQKWQQDHTKQPFRESRNDTAS